MSQESSPFASQSALVSCLAKAIQVGARGTTAWFALSCALLCGLAPTPSRAEPLSLLSVGVRARIGGERVLGDVSPEAFQEYDAVANIGLPWKWYSGSGWGVDTRLLAGVGALHGAEKTALVTSLIPIVALGSQDGRFTLDGGVGVAALSVHRFGRQDYGGPLQSALTLGASVPVYKRLRVGYRFLHYSDAGLYGSYTTGADFHMIELSYWLK